MLYTLLFNFSYIRSIARYCRFAGEQMRKTLTAVEAY